VHKVTLSNGVEFMCSETQTILEAAKLINVAIEHSCRSGRCGVCLAPILEGEAKVIFHEESLSNSDVLSGKILTCCRTPTTDIHLDIDDLRLRAN
jgi:CDP-4-dehydro-6-deoxyglucose reductase